MRKTNLLLLVFINKTFLPENISSERGTGETSFIPKNSDLLRVCRSVSFVITIYTYVRMHVFLSWNSFELATTR